jgi:hypothetical protein
MQRHTDQPFHPMAALDFAHPDRLAAVRVRFGRPIHRHETRSPMMVRDIPLDPAGDPGAEHADQRRFDHALTVEEIVAVGFVERAEDPSADFRQDANLEVLVFEIHGLPVRSSRSPVS